MGETKDSRIRGADSLEPWPLRPVEGDGSCVQRRSNSSGPSSTERPRHEASPHHPQADGSLCTENDGRADRPSEMEGPAPSGISVIPAQGHDATQVHHPKERRSADAGGALRKRGRLACNKRRHSNIIDVTDLKLEEVESVAEDRRLMEEALRQLATWLVRLRRETATQERKAA